MMNEHQLQDLSLSSCEDRDCGPDLSPHLDLAHAGSSTMFKTPRNGTWKHFRKRTETLKTETPTRASVLLPNRNRKFSSFSNFLVSEEEFEILLPNHSVSPTLRGGSDV